MNRTTKPMKNSFRALSLSPLLGLSLMFAGCAPRTDDSSTKKEVEGSKLVELGGKKGIHLSADSLKLAGVTLLAAGQDTLAGSMKPTGEITPTDSGTVQVVSRLPGRITSVLVSVGDRVVPGQILAYVDSNDLNQAMATYATAVSHANLSRNQLEQQKKLAGFGSLSEQPVEDAKKSAAAADAAVASDEAQIKVDNLALESTKKLIAMGEITRKPVEDAQNAYAQAQSASVQAGVTLHSAKANFERIQILYKGGVYSKQQFEDGDAAYKSAIAASNQANTSEKLAKEELRRQQSIFSQNLNGAASLQAAQSKVQQDQHTYESDLTSQRLAHTQYQRALAVRKSGIPISQALQQAQDTYDAAVFAEQSAANTLKLYGVAPGKSSGVLKDGRVVVPIVSPIKGIVAARAMVAGQMADTATPLLRLVNLDKVFVDASIYEADLAGVQMGDSVKVHVSAFPNSIFVGRVKWVAHEVAPDTRTITVRTIIDNPGWTLSPGMFASVDIGSKKKLHTISIPADAVMQESDMQIVYVQTAPGEFLKRPVKVGSPVGGKVAVETGLSSGEQVVVGGNVYIQKEQERLEGGKGKA